MPEPLTDFGNIRFDGTLRPSQEAACKEIVPQLENGETRLYVVAPPGSGKTVLGLYVWADLVKKPHWFYLLTQQSKHSGLLELHYSTSMVKKNSSVPTLKILVCLLHSPTKPVTAPGKGGEDIEEMALMAWSEKLIAQGEAHDHVSCEAWQTDLKEKNPDYYEERLGTYRKKVRDEIAKSGNAISILGKSAKENLERLKEVGVGLIILDECHHLMHHWGRILAEVQTMFSNPIILGTYRYST